MGKVPVRLREVTYTLSPFQQKVMSGLFKDAGYHISKKIRESLVDWSFCAVPVVGTVWYVLFLSLIPSFCWISLHERYSSSLLIPDKPSYPFTIRLIYLSVLSCRYANNYVEQEKLHHRF